MKKLINKIKENKKISIPIILILILIIGISTYFIINHFMYPEYKDGFYYDKEHGIYVGEESRFKDSVPVEEVLRPDSEFLGEYDNYNDETDLHFLMTLYEHFAKGNEDTQLINTFLDYKFPKGEYIVDSEGNKISIGMNNRRFMIFFADIGANVQGEFITDTCGNAMILNKEGLEEYFDMDVYILPRSIDAKKEDFFKVFSNGNYFNNNAISKTFAEILNKIENFPSTALYFNSDGSLLFATTMMPFDKGVDYLEYAIQSNVSIQESFPTILANYERDREERYGKQE